MKNLMSVFALMVFFIILNQKVMSGQQMDGCEVDRGKDEKKIKNIEKVLSFVAKDSMRPINSRKNSHKADVNDDVDDFNVIIKDGILYSTLDGEENPITPDDKTNWKFVIVDDYGKLVMRAAEKSEYMKKRVVEKNKGLHHPTLAGYDHDRKEFLPIITGGIIQKFDSGNDFLAVDSGNYNLDSSQLSDAELEKHLMFLKDFLIENGISSEIHSHPKFKYILTFPDLRKQSGK